MSGKKRLDLLLVERRLAASRSKAAAMIMAGEVFVENKVVDKAGTAIPSNADIRLKARPRFVSRGGLKLDAALAHFDISVGDKVCADVGASTGGFTDCLLQYGAARVYAIDVGSGIIDYRLRIDSRVRILENTNARYLIALEEKVSIVTVDVSFISLRLILPQVKNWLAEEFDIVVLVKPQFEAGKADIGKKGIVTDPAVHRRVLAETACFAESQGFAVRDLIRSPIKGQKGNVEFLMWLDASQRFADSADIGSKISSITAPTI